MAIIFLLKLTICWGFFALLYTLLLHRETFFRANRIYLLGSALAGAMMALPGDWLFGSPDEVPAGQIVLPVISAGLEYVETTTRQSNWFDYLWILYGMGALVALFRLFWGLSKIFRMRMNGTASDLSDGCILVASTEVNVPFSFFKWIFVPAAGSDRHPKSCPNSDAMLAHERAHALGWHSADVLLMELLCVAFWFHPLAHWYRRSLRTIHEYLADAEASEQTDKKQYGLMLIRQAHPGMSLAFVNHFFQSPLKQRLIMLTRHTSPALQAWKYSLALPVFILTIMVARQTSAQAQQDKTRQTGNSFELYEIDRLPEYPGGEKAMSRFLAENIEYPAGAKRDSAEGVVAVKFVIDDTGTVTGIENVTTNARPDLVEETIRVVGMMPKWTPARKDDKPVKVIFTLPVRFKLK